MLDRTGFTQHVKEKPFPCFFVCMLVCFIEQRAIAEQNPLPLQPQLSEHDIEEVFVTGTREGDFTIITEKAQKLINTAGTLGDPMAAVFSLPGVVSPSGDGGEPAVRGSSPADNIYLVDFLPASYIFHQFGGSVFNEFILGDFQLYSAGYGPEFENVTGAVFDVNLRYPRNEELKTILDLSMLRSAIFVEGGLTENSAFYASGRISVIDKFIDPEDFSDEEEGIRVQQIPKDHDYQLKYRWQPNDQHSLTIAANGAGDEAAAELTVNADFVSSNPDFAGDASLKSIFNGQSLLWDYQISSEQQLKVGLGNIKRDSNLYWGDNFSNEVQLTQQTLKAQYQYNLHKNHKLGLGTQVARFEYDYFIDSILFVCTEFDTSCDTARRGRITEDIDFEYTSRSAFINDQWSLTKKLTLDLGLQWIQYSHNDEHLITPRFAAAYQITNAYSVITKAGRYNRFPELETVLGATGNPNIETPEADHYVFGINYDNDAKWSWTVEIYQKYLDKLPLALPEESDDSQLRYISATEGKAYGLDILINKNFTHKWYGWVSLSVAKSERTNTLTDQTVDYQLDTPLIFNWVMNYQHSPNLNFGWRFTTRSGSAYTPIIGLQENPFFEGSILPVYGEPFSERLPNYYRLDLRLKWDFESFGRDSSLIVDIINATNNLNVTSKSLDFDEVESLDDELAINDETGLGIIPALTYRITF